MVIARSISRSEDGSSLPNLGTWAIERVVFIETLFGKQKRSLLIRSEKLSNEKAKTQHKTHQTNDEAFLYSFSLPLDRLGLWVSPRRRSAAHTERRESFHRSHEWFQTQLEALDQAQSPQSMTNDDVSKGGGAMMMMTPSEEEKKKKRKSVYCELWRETGLLGWWRHCSSTTFVLPNMSGIRSSRVLTTVFASLTVTSKS